MKKKATIYILISSLVLVSLAIFYILVISPNEKDKKEMRGAQQEKVLEKTEKEVGEQEPKEDDVVFCTQEVRRCPDGSFVGRIPPKCNFAPCKNPTNLK